MNTETRAKAKATKEAKAAEFATQTIQIDENWVLSRADELNWELSYKGKFNGYFGTLPAALHSLPAKMLGAETKNSLADLQHSLLSISERIDKALSTLQFIA